MSRNKKRRNKAKARKENRPMVQATAAVIDREPAPSNAATSERLARAGDDGYETAANGRQTMLAPLDRLHKAKLISDREFHAGDKLRKDEFASRIDPAAPTVDWQAVGGNFGSRVPSVFSAQSVADARDRWRYFDKSIRGLTRAVLENLVLREMPLEDIGEGLFALRNEKDARLAARSAARVALDTLANHYAT